MASWHQEKAGLQGLYAPCADGSYKVVENPLNGLVSSMTGFSLTGAQNYIERRVEVFHNGRRQDFFIVPPKKT
jgi:hypothetical protein